MTKEHFLNTYISRSSMPLKHKVSNTLTKYVGISHFLTKICKILLSKNCDILAPHKETCSLEAFVHSKVLTSLTVWPSLYIK